MNLIKTWGILTLSLQIAVLVTSRNLPLDDLQADSLVLVHKVRREIDMEGSGDDDDNLRRIPPLPKSIYFMERMAMPSENAEKTTDSDGPLNDPIPEVSDPNKEMVEEFTKEDGMELFKGATDEDPQLPANDLNRHDNTLNVIHPDDKSVPPLEDDTKHLSTDFDREEGSGDVDVEYGQPTPQLEKLEESDETNPAQVTTETVLETQQPSSKEEQEEEEKEMTVVTSEPIIETTLAPEENETTTNIPPTQEADVVHFVSGEESSVEPKVSTTEEPEPSPTTEIEIIETTQPTVPSSTESVDLIPSSVENTTPEDVIETTQTTQQVTEEKIETSTDSSELETTTPEILTEEINGTVIIPAVMGEKIMSAEESSPQFESKTSAISWYYVVGVLAVCLVVLIAVVAFRNRKRSHKLGADISQDRDTEKCLLSNGRFKEDSEDNNIKNNEITPLVIKQNSQINKFEKSPNFSSPKNLNIETHDKNIEKDNVLKSTQAIIEDEIDDAKKEVVDDDMQDEKKKAVEELSSSGPVEKVIVKTHVDMDSIPRKPIVINKNGHSYHSVPGGETKT